MESDFDKMAQTLKELGITKESIGNAVDFWCIGDMVDSYQDRRGKPKRNMVDKYFLGIGTYILFNIILIALIPVIILVAIGIAMAIG